MDAVVLELYLTYFNYMTIPFRVLRVSYDKHHNPVVVDAAQNYPGILIKIEDYFKHIGK